MNENHYIDRNSHRLIVKKRPTDEVRCNRCKSLLFKHMSKSDSTDKEVGIEIKCRKCGLTTKA